MTSGRLVLATVIILAIGVLVLPSTMSLFVGQHKWYDVDATGNNIPCEKCHADVFDEFRANVQSGGEHEEFIPSANRTNPTNEDIRKACGYCHRWNETAFASGDTGQPGKQAHAAATVACMLCHQYNAPSDLVVTSVAPPPIAGTFNVSGVDTNYNYTNATNWGELEAHNIFVKRAIEDPTMTDANEACIACHTHVRVKINWTHAYSLEFNATKEFLLTGGNTTHFNVTDWKINGSVVVTVYGNGTQGSTTGWP